MRERLLMLAAAAALGLGIAPTAHAQGSFIFGEDDSTIDFDLTSGSLTGANYYNDMLNLGGQPAPATATRVHLGNGATITNGVGEVFSVNSGISLGTTVVPSGPGGDIPYPDNATLNITGGSVATLGGGDTSFVVGDATSGTLNLSDAGLLTVAGRFAVGTGAVGNSVAGSNAVVNVSGGVLTVNGTQGIQVGPGQVTTASFNLSGGVATVSNGGFGVGQGGSDNNSVTVSGGVLTVNGGILRVGDGVNSSGNTFDQSGGVVNLNGTTAAGESLIIGAAGSGADSSEGSYSLSGGALNLSGAIQVGNNGSGSFTASGGVLNVGNNLVVGNFGDSDGIFTVDGSGAIINVSQQLAVSSGNPPQQPAAAGGDGTLSFIADNGGVSIIDVIGAATLGDSDSSASILLSISGDGTPDNVYDLVTASSFVGGLGNVSFSGPAGYFLRIVPAVGGARQTLQAVVPEPATCTLAVLALAGGALGRRRKA